ncbi:DUF423 domain-containing protein [Mesorhizobium sp. B2-1-8]|uniref:DUF423 domain-containing protein n=1 Tax=Mesorhizobium sp. B2-1-8 TaxID=2589967 RepID=UPI00112E76AB|nr:DUF423 domain-containing protein [Mesorhizobium sp. B2-1-8]UCI17837.1 DUF423 domain-containing protein [Mesorhizobium sp. B2-1-8]
MNLADPNGSRLLVLAGGLVGAAGVALSAAAAHRGGAFIGTAASFLLMHAPVFLAVGLVGGANRWLRIASLVLLAGLVLFAGDLLARDFLGSRLFPMSAPIGGTLLIVGWLAIAISALARPRS